MKKLSLILNVVLLVAVAFLYYAYFSKHVHHVAKEKPMIAKAVDSAMSTKQSGMPVIAFVNTDTLLAKYQFVLDYDKKIQDKQNRLQASYKKKANKLQSDYQDYQEQASKGLMTEAEAKAKQADLIKRKGELDNMQQEASKLMDETQQTNVKMQKMVSDYLKKYNKTHHYTYILAYSAGGQNVLLGTDSLDITNAVVKGLNDAYKQSQQSK